MIAYMPTCSPILFFESVLGKLTALKAEMVAVHAKTNIFPNMLIWNQ